MTTKLPIHQTGWYDDIPMETYHSAANLCIYPSLGSSGAIDIMSERSCPAKFWTNSDLNPDPIEDEEPDESKFDIGRAAHLVVLELEKWDEYTIVADFPTWQSKDAKAIKTMARESGLIPLLTKHQNKVFRMRKALEDFGLFDRWVKGGVVKGANPTVKTERSFVLVLDDAKIALKIRPDVYIETAEEVIMVNYKTTVSVAEDQFSRRVGELNYHQSEAFYRHVYAAVTGRKVTRYVHLVQEPKPPYLAAAYEIHPEEVKAGAQLNAPAVSRFAMCVQADQWPTYELPFDGRDGTSIIKRPVYEQMRQEERKEAGQFALTPDADATMKALWYAAQAPDQFKLPRVSS